MNDDALWSGNFKLTKFIKSAYRGCLYFATKFCNMFRGARWNILLDWWLLSIFLCSFRRSALLTSGDVVIAGLAESINEAKRVRDMREYHFWARGAVTLKICDCPRPERYCAIARRLAARPKKNDEDGDVAEAGLFPRSFYCLCTLTGSEYACPPTIPSPPDTLEYTCTGCAIGPASDLYAE